MKPLPPFVARLIAPAMFAALIACPQPALAQIDWTGGDDATTWGEAANWSSDPALPGPTDITRFPRPDVASYLDPAEINLGGVAREIESVIVGGVGASGDTPDLTFLNGTLRLNGTLISGNDYHLFQTQTGGENTNITFASGTTLDLTVPFGNTTARYQRGGTLDIAGNVTGAFNQNFALGGGGLNTTVQLRSTNIGYGGRWLGPGTGGTLAVHVHNSLALGTFGTAGTETTLAQTAFVMGAATSTTLVLAEPGVNIPNAIGTNNAGSTANNISYSPSSGTGTISGNIIFSGFNNILNLGSANEGGTLDIAGRIMNETFPAIGVRVAGPGTVMLSSPTGNTYGGPSSLVTPNPYGSYPVGTQILDGGTLIIQNTTGSATGVSAVMVTNGLLGGTGFIDDGLIIQAAGRVAPGINGAGTIGLSRNLFWQAGGVMQFDLGPSADQIHIGGDLVKDGAGPYLFEFNLTGGSGFQTFTLLTFDDFDGFTMEDFSYVFPDQPEIVGGFELLANELRFVVIPEPRAALLLLAGIALVAARSRKRRNDFHPSPQSPPHPSRRIHAAKAHPHGPHPSSQAIPLP